jgi:hypothetical protein
MQPADLLQYPGVALGLIGAVLVSQGTTSRRRRGFQLWIGSNVLLIAWAVQAAAWGLLAMYAVYTVTSLMGWWNNRAPPPQQQTEPAPAPPDSDPG